MSEKRIDQLLVELKIFESRSKAQAAIEEGLVSFKQKKILRPSTILDNAKPEDFEIQSGQATKYVSRGGLKLEGAIKKVSLDLKGKHVLDVGQSTGGFTDCLIQHNVDKVVGIDVGSGQIHPKILKSPRVQVLENVNIREFKTKDTFDVCVIDVSFISLQHVFPIVVNLIKGGGEILALVKPQFELSADKIGKGGVVKDATHYQAIENAIKKLLVDLRFNVIDYFESSILGGDGNKEFFVYAKKMD